MTSASTLNRVAACNPERIPRTAEALHSPQEHINAATIEADESWLARNWLRIAAALMIAVFCVVTAARAADYVVRKTEADLRWYHQLEAMK